MKISRAAIAGLLAVQAVQPAWASSPWGNQNPSAGYNPAHYQQEQQSYDPAASAPVSDRQPPLPPGWIEYFDPSSGLPYYFNEKDGTTTWDRPVPDEEEASPPPSGEDMGQSLEQEDGSMQETPQASEQAPPKSENPMEQQQQAQQPEPQIASTEPYFNTTEEATRREGEEEEATYEPSPGWGMPDQQSTPPAFGRGPSQQQAKPQDNARDSPTLLPGTPKSEETNTRPNEWTTMDRTSQESPSMDRPPQHQPGFDPRQGRAPEQMPPWGQRPPQGQQILQGDRSMQGETPPQQKGPPQQQQTPQQPNRFLPPLQPGSTVPPPTMRPAADTQAMPPRHPQQQQPPLQQRPPQQQMPPPQRQMPPQGYQPSTQQQQQQQQPPQQQNPYGQYSQPRSQPPPYGQYYSQYSQYGQYQGYGRQPPQQQRQLIPAETTTAVQGALSNAWQGILGFSNRTKEAVESARTSVVESAKEASQTISSTSTSKWVGEKRQIDCLMKF